MQLVLGTTSLRNSGENNFTLLHLSALHIIDLFHNCTSQQSTNVRRAGIFMIDPGPEMLTEWPRVAQLLPKSAAVPRPVLPSPLGRGNLPPLLRSSRIRSS